MWHLWAAVAALLTVGAGAVAVRAPAWPTAFASPAPAPSCVGRSVFEVESFHAGRQFAHAVSAVLLRDGRLRAVWYEGSGELSPDVRIWTATFDGMRWSAPRPIVGPAETAAGTGRYVRKLGNPLLFRAANGELALVFASLGIGGWDLASLKMTQSGDDGETWSPPRSLITAPIFNWGTNVRGPAVPTAGAFTLVPASHEFVRPFPEVVLLDGRGRVVGKRRIGISFGGSQPFISVRDERRATAFMRVDWALTPASSTDDAGWSWTEPAQTPVPNYDAPVVVARIGGDLFMISSRWDAAARRWTLVFATSGDEGRSWRDIHSHPFGSGVREIPRYPWLVVGPDGLFHVLFTFTHGDGSSELMHVRLSRDWIAARGGPPCR